MKGYLLNFYKNSPLREDMIENEYMRNRFNNEFVRNVVWSIFDRLEIREINEFESFRQPGESEKKWVGERQFSMIYQVGENSRLEYDNNPEANKCKFAFKPSSVNLDQEGKLRFFGVSIVDFTTLAYDEFFSKDKSMEYARETILNVLDELCVKNNISTKSICYDVYGSLGGSDAVIIWLSNQFKDIMLLADVLRASNFTNAQKGLISNIYTILGVRDIENNSIEYNDVEGEFHIHLTKRVGSNINEFKNRLDEIIKEDVSQKIYTVAGEHDITVVVPGNIVVSSLYSAGGLIHMGTPEYYNNFIQANTEVCIQDDFSKSVTTEINISSINEIFTETHEIETHEIDIYNLVNTICESDMLKQTTYLGDTLWILYSDYMKNITSTLSHPWTQDLYYQFYSCLMCLKSVTEEYDKEKSFNVDNYNYIEIIIKNLRQIILHIAQANRIFFEVPNTHLKNTGTYSKVLRTYQGITKELIKQAYLIPKSNAQTEIIPFINFDSIPIPVSHSYKIPANDKLLVEIKLPYEALVDIKRYTYLLAHEVYHYIAPTNRKIRNEILNIIIVSTLIKLTIEEYVAFYIEQKKLSVVCEKQLKQAFSDTVSKYTLHYVINHFDNICLLNKKYDVQQSRNDYLTNINKTIRLITSNDDFCKIIYNVMIEYSYNSFIQNVEDEMKYKDYEREYIEQNSQIAKLIVQQFHNLRVNNNFDVFYNWIRHNLKFEPIYDGIKKIEKALIEIMPDYYMIQVTQMDSKIYYKEILRIRKILYPADKNIDNQLRIALIYNYCFLADNRRAGKIDQNQWEYDLCIFIENLLVNDDDANYLWDSISGQYKFISNYDMVLSKYFSLLHFDNYIDNKEFLDSLKDIKSKIKASEDNSFETNIACIEMFQLQESLAALKDYITVNADASNDKWRSMGMDVGELYSQTDESPIAEDFNTLILFLKNEAQKIMDYPKEEIWYRGHEQDSYKLIPSLYRMNSGKFYNSSLRGVMDTLYKAFRVMSYSVPEIFSGGNDTTIGTMASMQHYSLPTNILDWTPSVLNAIYFAVESTILEKENKSSKADGEIWLLNPARLNECRNNNNIDSETYPVPYIMGNDEEIIKPYLPLYQNKEQITDNNSMPLAVYVPYVNQRIKAQNGTFTMFSLDIDVVSDKGKKDFSMCDLYEWQKKIEKDDSYGNYKPFIKKVRISNEAKKDIADRLKLMGIQKHTIYPELENIAQDFKNQIHDFLKYKGR